MNIVPRRMYLDSIFDDFLKNDNLEVMKCDIYEKDGNYYLEADIPGFSKNDIKIDLNDGYLTITASKEDSNDENDRNYIKKERVSTQIQRQFYVGDVEAEEIKAEFNNGILKITIPEQEKPKNNHSINID